MALTQKITSMPSQEEAANPNEELTSSQRTLFDKPAQKLHKQFETYQKNKLKYDEAVLEEKPVKDAMKEHANKLQLFAMIVLVCMAFDFFVTKITILPFAAMFQVPYWIPTAILLVLDFSFAAASASMKARYTGDLAAARHDRNKFGGLLWTMALAKGFLIVFHALNSGGLEFLLTLDTLVNTVLLALVYFALHFCAEGPGYLWRSITHGLKLFLIDPQPYLSSMKKTVRKLRQDARQVQCNFETIVSEFELAQVVELCNNQQETK